MIIHIGRERQIHPLGEKVKTLVGSGDKIGKAVLPFLLVGLALNVLRPAWFSVGGPSATLAAVAWAMLAVGVVIWLWTVVLILTRVPKHQLITSGPFRLMKHPLYTGVSLLVIPAIGFLLNSWLGVVLGIVIYLASRRYAPEEERALAETFGPAWDEYSDRVVMPWL
jgi:protein-S-isoprenylcysteine O-methyltransferase Ste14